MDIIKIEREGKRVLTTQQLAEAYGVDVKHISDNYLNNSGRYKEGVHFFKLEGEQLKEFKEANPNISGHLKYARALVLWTERGALYHAKSLGTDEAWEVYDKLVETYFRAQEMVSMLDLMKNDYIIAMRYEQLMMKKALEEANRRQDESDKKHALTEAKIDNIKGSFARQIENWRKDTNDILNHAAKTKGLDYRELRNECYALFRGRAHCNLELRLKRLRSRMVISGATKTITDSMNYLDVIGDDDKLVNIYVGVVRELAAKYI
jgi:hypothetical protein